jgi:integrase
MDLAALLETQYFPLKTSITSDVTRRRYRRAVAWLSVSVRHAATVADLTDDTLAAVATHLSVARRQCPRTINGTLECLRALWRWSRDRGLATGGPTFAPLKVAARAPRAWREEELNRLVQAADAQPGSIGGMPARVWWLTLLTLVMDTGARATELLSLRWEWLDFSAGTLSVDASVRKGGTRFACYGLRRDTLDWLAAIKRPDGLILCWDYDQSRLYQLYGKLLQSAGLPNTRYTKLHCLRRTFATLLEVNGGNATIALGHASRATTLRSYLDPTRTARVHADVIPFHPLRAITG